MAMALTQVLVLALVQYSGDEPSGSLVAKELDANRRRIMEVFFYFLFKIKCLKTYKKAFPFNVVVEWVWMGGCSAPVGRMVGRRLLSEQTGGADN